jgi:hypothetical protein
MYMKCDVMFWCEISLHAQLTSSTAATAAITRVSFDARPVLQGEAGLDWGVVRAPGLHLSTRFASDADGYYRTEASVLFP